VVRAKTACVVPETVLSSHSQPFLLRGRTLTKWSTSTISPAAATDGFKSGLPTILELVLAVLDAQRELYANEDFLAQCRTTQAVNLIALYKALGGVWQSVTLQ